MPFPFSSRKSCPNTGVVAKGNVRLKSSNPQLVENARTDRREGENPFRGRVRPSPELQVPPPIARWTPLFFATCLLMLINTLRLVSGNSHYPYSVVDTNLQVAQQTANTPVLSIKRQGTGAGKAGHAGREETDRSGEGVGSRGGVEGWWQEVGATLSSEFSPAIRWKGKNGSARKARKGAERIGEPAGECRARPGRSRPTGVACRPVRACHRRSAADCSE